MYFKHQDNLVLAQKIIEKWYLPVVVNRKISYDQELEYAIWNHGVLEKKAISVKEFLSKDVNLDLDGEKILGWFAVLDNLDYYSNLYPEKKYYFETFWINLKQLYDFYWSIDKADEPTEEFIKGVKQAGDSFFYTSEKYFKGLMFLLGKRNEVESLERNKLFMPELFRRFNQFFGGAKYLDIYTNLAWYRNSIHGDSREVIPDNEKICLPTISKGYNLSNSQQQSDARQLVDITRLFVAGFLRLVMCNQSAMEEEVGKLIAEEEIDNGLTADTPVDLEPILNCYIHRIDSRTQEGFVEEARKIGGNCGALIHMGVNLVFTNWMETDQRNDQRKDTYVPIESLPDYQDSRVLFLLGSPGAGKTTLLNQLVHLYAAQWSNPTESVLPILIKFKGSGGPKEDPDVLIRRHLLSCLTSYNTSEMAAMNDLFDHLATEGRLVLLFDGLNELKPDSEPFLKSLASLLSGNGKFGRCRVFLTDRLYEFQYHQEYFRTEIKDKVSVFQLAQISKGLIVEHLKTLGIPDLDQSRFLATIENERVGALLGVPLNFMMLMQVVKSTAENTRERDKDVKSRGELLEKFMRAIINDSKDVLNKKNYVNPEVTFHLQQLALRCFQSGSKSIAKSKLCQDIPSDFVARNLLSIQDGDDPQIAFAYDTYREFFMGRYLAFEVLNKGETDLKSFEQTWLTPKILNDPNLVETFKLALEVLLAQKDGEKAALWLIETIYEHGRTKIPKTIADSALPPVNLEINCMLELLCNMVKDTPNGSKPFDRVSQWVLNELIVFRLNNPAPTDELIKKQKGRLIQAISCATCVNSQLVNKELFGVYWMALLGVVDRKEFGFHMSNSISKGTLLNNISGDARNVFDTLFELSETMRLGGLNVSQGRIQKFFLVLFNKLKDSPYSAEMLYNHIEDLREKRQDASDELLHFSASLAFCFGSVESLPKRAHLDILKKRNTRLGWIQLFSLLHADGDQSAEAMELALSDCFLDVVRVSDRQEMAITALTFFINRSKDSLPAPVHQFLFSDVQKAISILKESGYKSILDLIPLSQIPESIRERYYNPGISAYIMSHSRCIPLSETPLKPIIEDRYNYLPGDRFESLCKPIHDTGTAYRILKRGKTQTTIITRKVTERMPCWIKIGNTIYSVTSIEPIHDVVEMEFETAMPVTFPDTGFVCGADTIKYFYNHVSQNGKRHLILLDNNPFEETHDDSQKPFQVEAQDYYLGHYRLRLNTIRLLPTKGLYSLWVLKTCATDFIPKEGYFQVDKQLSFKHPRSATLLLGSVFDGVLDNLSVIAAHNDSVYLTSPSSNPALTPGNWIRIGGNNLYLPIFAAPKKMRWTVELSFICRWKLPTSGSLSLQGCSSSVLFHSKHADETGNNIWTIFPMDDTLSARDFLQIWASIDDFSILSSSKDVNEEYHISRKEAATVMENDSFLIQLRTAFWDEQWLSSPITDIGVPHPCLMPAFSNEDEDNGILLHQVYYQSTQTPGVIRIVTPETLEKDLWFSLDNGPLCRMGIPEGHSYEGLSFLYIHVSLENGTVPRINQHGQMQLFRDAEGTPANIKYNSLLKSIILALPRPELVHASICPYLVNELLDLRLMSAEVLSFFENKSAVHLLFEHSLLTEQIYKLESKKPLLNYCIIHNSRPGNQFFVYSPRLGKILAPIPPVGNETGMYVLCEKNNRSYYVGAPSRIPICGFMEGVIITLNNEDGYATTEYGDYYIPKCSLEKGTKISFFPDQNVHYSKNSVNRHGEKVNSKMASDIKVIDVLPWEESEVMKIRWSKDQKDKQWVELTLKGLSGSILGRIEKVSIPLSHIAESGNKQILEGSRIQVIEYAQKWIVNL